MQNRSHQKTFNTSFLNRVITYKEKLKEVETSSIEEVLENFSKDLYPEQELIVWEMISLHYENGTLMHPEWDLTAKKEHYKSVFAQSFGING